MAWPFLCWGAQGPGDPKWARSCPAPLRTAEPTLDPTVGFVLLQFPGVLDCGLSHCYYLDMFLFRTTAWSKTIKYQFRVNATRNSNHPSSFRQRNATGSWERRRGCGGGARPTLSSCHTAGGWLPTREVWVFLRILRAALFTQKCTTELGPGPSLQALGVACTCIHGLCSYQAVGLLAQCQVAADICSVLDLKCASPLQSHLLKA